MRKVFFTGLLVIGLAAAMAMPATPALAQDVGTVIAKGFNGPQGVLAAPDGSVWVIEAGRFSRNPRL